VGRSTRNNAVAIRSELEAAIAAHRHVVVHYREDGGAQRLAVAEGVPLRIAPGEKGRDHVVIEVVAGWTQRAVWLERIVRVVREAA
jgi:hypothetical protein